MPPVTAVIITHNEASNIERCLSSLSDVVDELLVVDSGSTDNTVEIATRCGARVINKEWLGFGPQKQFGVDAAKNDWVICLDADEWLSPELAESIRKIGEDPTLSAYILPRRNRFLGHWLRHGEGYPDYTLRFFDRRKARWRNDPVHESVEAEGPVKKLRGDLMHDSAPDLKNYLSKQNRYTSLQAEQMRASGKQFSLMRMVFSPLVRFVKFYVLRAGFLDGIPGLVHICIGCWNTSMKQAKLYALLRQEK